MGEIRSIVKFYVRTNKTSSSIRRFIITLALSYFRLWSDWAPEFAAKSILGEAYFSQPLACLSILNKRTADDDGDDSVHSDLCVSWPRCCVYPNEYSMNVKFHLVPWLAITLSTPIRVKGEGRKFINGKSPHSLSPDHHHHHHRPPQFLPSRDRAEAETATRQEMRWL